MSNRKLHKAFLGVGSNIGDRKRNIEEAFQRIEAAGIKIIKKSEIVETEPYGLKAQPNFLNCAVEVETNFNPGELLATLLSIELEMGRVRKIHWGPRIIDLDILFFDDSIVATSNLKIPHPDLQNRLFVLEPLSQIAPYYKHPVINKTVKEMLDELKGKNSKGNNLQGDSK
ncbi:MAG: 2-amino-4-hydroxy-6-hydroxymethyldihydropteridine diphosphokinase [Caldisericaceae bacterium]